MIAVLLLTVAGAFSAPTKTSWMSPDAFHVAVGMPRSKVVAVLEAGGWKPHPGKTPEHLLVEYGEARSITMEFAADRLRSAAPGAARSRYLMIATVCWLSATSLPSSPHSSRRSTA